MQSQRWLKMMTHGCMAATVRSVLNTSLYERLWKFVVQSSRTRHVKPTVTKHRTGRTSYTAQCNFIWTEIYSAKRLLSVHNANPYTTHEANKCNAL